MSFIEITDPTPDPTPPEKCPIGPEGHRWVLSMDMGVSLALAAGEVCPPAQPDEPRYVETVCEEQVLGSYGMDVLTMAPIPVSLSFGADHPNLGGWHGDMPCDCNWWWEITPESARERDAEKGEG